MAKIDPITSSLNPVVHELNPQKKKKVKNTNKNFFFNLLSLDKEKKKFLTDKATDAKNITRDDLYLVIDEMHLLGKKMASKQSMDSIIQYKKSIQKFLKFIVENSYSTELLNQKQNSIFANLGKQKQYTIIRTIDTKLENLAAEVLSIHKDNISILNAVDEIHGLLINLIA